MLLRHVICATQLNLCCCANDRDICHVLVSPGCLTAHSIPAEANAHIAVSLDNQGVWLRTRKILVLLGAVSAQSRVGQVLVLDLPECELGIDSTQSGPSELDWSGDRPQQTSPIVRRLVSCGRWCLWNCVGHRHKIRECQSQ